ncbi:MAG: hypothetical protein QXI58_02790 [Candidatus Micrarchaeia archaeon]
MFGEKKKSKLPFEIRLASHKQDSSTLFIKIKNLQEDSCLTSINLVCEKGIGVDQSCITNSKEVRLGFLKPNEEREVKIPIYSSVTTEPGNYKIVVSAISHYRTYDYVGNEMKVEEIVRVI